MKKKPDQFEDMFREFLRDNRMEEKDLDENTPKGNIREFFTWMKDSGLLTVEMY